MNYHCWKQMNTMKHIEHMWKSSGTQKPSSTPQNITELSRTIMNNQPNRSKHIQNISSQSIPSKRNNLHHELSPIQFCLFFLIFLFLLSWQKKVRVGRWGGTKIKLLNADQNHWNHLKQTKAWNIVKCQCWNHMKIWARMILKNEAHRKHGIPSGIFCN